ncbi:Cct domain, partial [Globisporangium splendens]
MRDDSTKLSMCLSPQDKLKGSLAQRKKVHDAVAVVKKEVMDVDMDSGWISDDNLRAMDLDESLNQDIDWVVHDADDDLELSLKMEEFEHDHDVASDFGFGPSSFLSPLRGSEIFTFDDSSEVSSSFGHQTKDAEKLLMSFDTMNFTIPSPTSSSSKKRRTNLFGKKESTMGGAATLANGSNAAAKGSMSPSLKVSARAVAGEDSQDEALQGASKSGLTGATAGDPFLGVLSITAPNGERGLLSGSDNTKKIGSYSPAARKLRIQKFHEKRKNRTWKKSIKYDCRKKLADDRPRIKGRFVRVLENMCDMKDDEPMSPTGEMSPLSVSSFTPPVTPMSSPEPASPEIPSMASSLMVVMPVAVPAPVPAPVVVPAAAPVQAITPVQSLLAASTAAIASLVASTS